MLSNVDLVCAQVLDNSGSEAPLTPTATKHTTKKLSLRYVEIILLVLDLLKFFVCNKICSKLTLFKRN